MPSAKQKLNAYLAPMAWWLGLGKAHSTDSSTRLGARTPAGSQIMQECEPEVKLEVRLGAQDYAAHSLIVRGCIKGKLTGSRVCCIEWDVLYQDRKLGNEVEFRQ